MLRVTHCNTHSNSGILKDCARWFTHLYAKLHKNNSRFFFRALFCLLLVLWRGVWYNIGRWSHHLKVLKKISEKSMRMLLQQQRQSTRFQVNKRPQQWNHFSRAHHVCTYVTPLSSDPNTILVSGIVALIAWIAEYLKVWSCTCWSYTPSYLSPYFFFNCESRIVYVVLCLSNVCGNIFNNK